MRIGARVRAASTALAVISTSLTFAVAGTGTAHAGSTSCAAVLGGGQYIWAGGRTIGNFYLAWNYCDPNNKVAYTEVNIWNTNFVNGNWHNGLIDVKSSSDHASNTGSPQPNAGSWWWDSGFIKVAPNVHNDRRYHGSMNFNAGGHQCWGDTPTWDFSGAGVVAAGSVHCT